MVMTTKIILPWEADLNTPEAVWAKGSLSTRAFFEAAHTPLTGKKLRQAIAISKAVIQSRVWISCLSPSPYHMRTLYPVIAGAWVYSRRDTADIMEADTLLDGVFAIDVDKKKQFRDIMLGTGLLILPYIDPNHMGIKKARSAFATLLMKRKLQRLPTIVDLKVEKEPTNGQETTRELEAIQDVWGESTTALFKADGYKTFLVSVKE